MKPLLSIVIPAYNVQKFIAPSIRSALNQEYIPIEVIVVDDGSSDSTLDQINSIKASNLKVIAQKNRGVSAARNSGISCSSGAYIGLLDGDDLWYPEKAKIHIDLMENNPEIGLTGSYLACINETGKPNGQLIVHRGGYIETRDLIRRASIMTSSTIIRKSCFKEAGLFDEHLRALQDYDMWLRISQSTEFKIYMIPKVLTAYRVRSDSLSETPGVYLLYAGLFDKKWGEQIAFVQGRGEGRATAEIFRISSRKALYAGHIDVSLSYLNKAIHSCPSLIFTDLRAIGTFVLVWTSTIMSKNMRKLMLFAAKTVISAFYFCYVSITSLVFDLKQRALKRK